MGTNVVRLVRSDHRRISELLARLNGRHRGGTALHVRIANELTAHVTACRDCLLPFAESRVRVDEAVGESLDSLQAAAGELRCSADDLPAATITALVETMDGHIDSEEREILRPLEGSVTVDRLRLVGESFRRVRDSAMRAEGGPQRRRSRPPTSRAELYEQARYRKIAGRSAMSKAELLEALKEQQ